MVVFLYVTTVIWVWLMHCHGKHYDSFMYFSTSFVRRVMVNRTVSCYGHGGILGRRVVDVVIAKEFSRGRSATQCAFICLGESLGMSR